MRALLAASVLVIGLAAPVRADDGLTMAVARAFLPRTVDAGLQAIAHHRVAELAACECLEHDHMRPGTAEVSAYNFRMPSPVASAVSQWVGSPAHNAILSNPTYGRIGCAEAVTGETHWFICVLAPGPLPVIVAAVAPVTRLPNTAMAPRAAPCRRAAWVVR